MLGLKTFEWIRIPFKEYDTIEGETRYYKISDDVQLPSMTSILNLLDDGGIEEWRKRVGEDEADKIVNEAVKRGNNLHDLSERYLKNELNRGDIKGPGAILFNRSKPLLDELGPIIGIEVPLYSIKHKYAGRVDCIAFHGKDFCIVDHKNSRKSINFKKKYARRKIFKYMLQTFGYARALKEMYPELPMATHGLLIVGNHEANKSTKIKFELTPLEKEFNILLDAYYKRGDLKESGFHKL
jgi:hypothetical protein